jgi:hypothetical protein
MTASEQEGLVARIRQVRRVASARNRPTTGPAEPQPSRVEGLEARLAHLENLVEGLQDSVHRESDRHSRLITELQDQIDPGAMRAALARDERERGL